MHAHKLHFTRAVISSFLLAAILVVLIVIGPVFAAAPADSLIRNQASATYRDSDGVVQSVTSNVVETLVRQVAGLTLNQDQLERTNAGGSVIFPHVIVNEGNGPDSFSLSVNQLGGDNFDFFGVELFADADSNGLADNTTPITSTPLLATDESFAFVVVASVPVGVPAAEFGEISVLAESAFNNSVSDTNVDRATIVDGAVINVSKSMNVTVGQSPSSPYTVTLDYRNDGNAPATNVVLIDRLPDGMEYIPASAVWSENGGIVLTDADPSDVQGPPTQNIQYCAYQSNCTGIPESIRDIDSDSTNQVTAIISQVPAGAQGSVTFDVAIATNVEATALFNAAEFEYTSAGTLIDRAETNIVGFQIDQVAGVVANGSDTSSVDGTLEPVSVASAAQGSALSFDNFIWNTGTTSDIIDVIVDNAGSTFPPGTAFQLFGEDGATPLLDSNGNGIPDTGPLAVGENRQVVLRATLPPDASGDNNGAGYEVITTARSTSNPSSSNTVINELDNIGSGSIDLVYSPVGVAPAGTGAGPEAAAVIENTAQPGTTTRFRLHVANNGTLADQLVLSASTDSTFASETLPQGWTIDFRNADDTESISSTGSIPGSDIEVFFADISIPAGQAPVTQSLFFRALSPASTLSDVLHVSVVVGNTAALLLEPAGTAQVEAGGSVVYSHRIENTGNTAIGPIDFTTSDSLAASGWASKVFQDSDGDDVFTAADAELSTIANLAANQSQVIFVRVSSSANTPSGAFNVTTLTASSNTGGTVTTTDTTTIAAGDIAIVKEQAPDLGCDGTLDGPYSRQPFSLEPGNNCVSYRLTATNAGVEPVFNALITDATPAFTVYQPTAVCSAASCVITEPPAGGTGVVSGEIPTVAPGESVELTFAVVIE